MQRKLVSPVPPLSCFLVCVEVYWAFFEVSLVWVSAVAALEGGMKALFTLGRAVRMATGMEVSWMLTSTNVGIVFTLGGVVSKGKTFIALSVWPQGEVLLNFELCAEDAQASGDCLDCCIFARNCKNHGGC